MRNGALLAILVLWHYPTAFSQLLPVDFSVNAVSFLKSRYPNLRGQGITICQKEQAPDAANIDLRGRLLSSALTSPVVTPHATQMATILVGMGNSSPLSEGIAPQATLISANFTSLLPESDAFYRSNHVTVVNHSYGTDIENFYGNEAVAYDASTLRLPTLLPIFSAGNLGYASSPTGPYANLPTVATLTGNFKMAKNSLVVGAVDAAGTLLPSSSRGPAYDGRLKPELVAYGDEGSSGSAALASGVTALLQQAFRQKIGTDASAALIKAVLINAADDAGVAGIDFETGYGNINAFSAAKTILDNQYLESSVVAGGQFETTIQVPATQRLKITLVWTDPPAAQNGAKALVNDLDLTVSDGRTTWQPWVLNPFPNLDSLRKAPVRMRDTLNNVEQITLDGLAPGAYTIRVSGTRMKTGPQSFALAYQWEQPGTFYWTMPNLSMPVVSDSTLTIRWKNTHSSVYGTLDFSGDQGLSWTPVRDSVVLATGSLSWKTPDLFTRGQLRMRIADTLYVSDPFTLSPIPVPTVLYACADSVGIAWTTATGGTSGLLHTLYRLSSQAAAWEKVQVLGGNQTVIRGVRPGDLWAVAPVMPTGEVGIRSAPVGGQQVSCYYRTLTARLVDRAVEVQCELSALASVTAITVQKQTARGMRDVETQSVTGTKSIYTVQDSLPEEGPNTYRVQIRLANGAIVYSDFATAYVIRSTPFLLYPNPVQSGQVLTLRTAAYGLYQLRIVDLTGRTSLDSFLSGTETELPTAGLAAGLYSYTIFQDNRCIQAGKLLIR